MHVLRQIYRLARLCIAGKGAKLSLLLLGLVIALYPYDQLDCRFLQRT
jgi:hypothetical protein